MRIPPLIFSFALLLGAGATLHAQPLPEWWTDPQTAILDPNAASNNHGPANLAQLKFVAYQAKTYLDSALPGGAGSTIDSLVASFGTTDNQRPINLAQLKVVGKPFYDRLLASGYNTRQNLIDRGYPSNWPYDYPWDPNTPVSQNYGPANIGQLKMVFSFGNVNPIILNEFDFAIIRYKWTAANGDDLDTRTALINVDPSVDGDDVGWSRNTTVPVSSPLQDAYLAWGGDNTTTSGVESVLVDLKSVAEDYPALSTITVRLRAFWFDSRADGNIEVEFETYLGGQMIEDPNDSYNFVNVGGTLVDHLIGSTNVATEEGDDIDGEEVGILTYEVASKTATLQIVP